MYFEKETIRNIVRQEINEHMSKKLSLNSKALENCERAYNEIINYSNKYDLETIIRKGYMLLGYMSLMVIMEIMTIEEYQKKKEDIKKIINKEKGGIYDNLNK